jgi:delta 1-pyrroline-5-carboxylate dehydrogenase
MPQPFPETPSMPKTLRKALHLQGKDGLSSASSYLAQCFKSADQLKVFLPGATLPAQVLITATQEIIRERQLRKAEKLRNEAVAEAQYDKKRKEDARQHDLAITTSLVTLSGPSRIRYIASLAPEDRIRFASKQEQREGVDLRKSCVTTYNARTLIEATQTEFDRWVDDGLITPVFIKRISVGKMVNARYWSTAELEALKARIPTLRETWAARKKARRTKLKLVKA